MNTRKRAFFTLLFTIFLQNLNFSMKNQQQKLENHIPIVVRSICGILIYICGVLRFDQEPRFVASIAQRCWLYFVLGFKSTYGLWYCYSVHRQNTSLNEFLPFFLRPPCIQPYFVPMLQICSPYPIMTVCTYHQNENKWGGGEMVIGHCVICVSTLTVTEMH